ncbi:hypothetical protein PENTCL1PPCAC_7853, partial [Pristionchus entomophagus]
LSFNMYSAPATIANYCNMIQVDESTVRSDPPFIGAAFIRDRTFGGLVISQATNAFTTLNPFLTPHTVNYKFIATANTSTSQQFKLSHFEEDNIASVLAYQNEKLVGMGHIRYAHNSDHFDSSSFLCPKYIGSAECYPSTAELAETFESEIKEVMTELSKFPLEIRPVESPHNPLSDVNRSSIWLRIKPQFSDDLKPYHGLSVAMFISDFNIHQVAWEIFEKANVKISFGASLDHSAWIHEANLDPLAWYLTVVKCEVISFGRLWLESRIFDESRKCVMTVVQEGYMLKAEDNISKL